jgi:DNA-binding NarL/FixJ family response regulator
LAVFPGWGVSRHCLRRNRTNRARKLDPAVAIRYAHREIETRESIPGLNLTAQLPLQDSIPQSLYRTEEERQIFEMMVEGKSAEEIREHIHQSTATVRVAPTGEIELF